MKPISLKAIDRIIGMVSEEMGIPVADIVTTRRQHTLSVSWCKYMVAALVMEHTFISANDLAPRIGYKDHTGCLRGIAVVREAFVIMDRFNQARAKMYLALSCRAQKQIEDGVIG